MKVFICEKPSQGKDIAPHVGARQQGKGCLTGPGVAVTWCIGHLLEQAKPEHYNPDLRSWSLDLLPVCPDKWVMEVKSSTADQFRAVQAVIRQASEVIIATDADREGEVIARSVLDRLGYRGPVRRLWLGALDSVSVKKALDKLLPNEKTLPMYFSGMGRARADWLTGMNMTMALTSAFGAGGRGGVLHCGRVQTPVLALIVRRERAIVNFKPKTHYLLGASFEMQGVTIPMDWRMPVDRLDHDDHCVDKALVDAVAQKINRKTGRLTQVVTTPERELAPLPYSLDSLQQEASARYGLKVQSVLDACQALYEKHKATTYPRTDCEHLPVSMFADVPVVFSALTQVDPSLAKLVAAADVSRPGRAFNDKKVTAHHAIIPTGNTGVRMNDLSQVERLVYDLVRRRYLAQFLGDFLYNKTVIEVVCEGEAFAKTGKMPTSQGWKRVNAGLMQPTTVVTSKMAKPRADEEDKTSAEVEVALPTVKVGDQAINRRAETVVTKTRPPKRFTEGTLLAAMESIDKIIDDPRLKRIMQTKEKAGIGTGATRAGIVEGLFKRDYIASSKRFIVPTDKGNSLVEVIESMAPQLADPVLTAEWEDKLMQIETGKLELVLFERELAGWLRQVIDNIRTQAALRPPRLASPGWDAGRPGATAGPVYACELCKSPLKQRKGSSGLFWGCSTYPTCRNTLPDQDGKPVARLAQAVSPAPKAAVAVVPAMPSTRMDNLSQGTSGTAFTTLPLAAHGGAVRPGTPWPEVHKSGLSGGAKNLTKAVGAAAGAVATATEAKTCGCGKPMRLRTSARGPFYGCSGFPDCRNIESV